MSDQEQTPSWVKSLITELKLPGEKNAAIDITDFRVQVEKSQLLERVRKVVAEINRAVGYHILDLLEYLPPSRSLLRVSFTEKRTEYIFEVTISSGGPKLVFHSAAKIAYGWERYLYTAKSHVALTQSLIPLEITQDVVQTWFAYVLSRFKNKFKPKEFNSRSHGDNAPLSCAINEDRTGSCCAARTEISALPNPD
jgi:hypothetical protein